MSTHHFISRVCRGLIMATVFATAGLPDVAAQQMTPEIKAAFDRYVALSEQRMTQELQSGPFLYINGTSSERDADRSRLHKGEVLTERLETKERGQSIRVPGGLIHHWRGIVFIPGVTLAQTLAFLQDYDNQHKFFGPDVQRSRLLQRNGNDFNIFLQLRKHKIMTVTLNTNYNVRYKVISADRATSYSYSTRIAEAESVGKPNESERPPGSDGGFLWRLNSYWRFLERDGGTYVQLEAISLTRDIPASLQWLIGPFVTSIPRESLTFTLTRTQEGLQAHK